MLLYDLVIQDCAREKIPPHATLAAALKAVAQGQLESSCEIPEAFSRATGVQWKTVALQVAWIIENREPNYFNPLLRIIQTTPLAYKRWRKKMLREAA